MLWLRNQKKTTLNYALIPGGMNHAGLNFNLLLFSESGKVIHKKTSEEEDMDELKEQKVRGIK